MNILNATADLAATAHAPREPTPPGIDAHQLRKHYGDVTALDDIDLSIPQGAFVSVLGPSGSGKTTLLGVVAGFVTPDEGQVLISGRDVTLLPAQQRGIGVVFQHYALFPHMSVAENVAFPLYCRRLPKSEVRSRVDRALEMVGLHVHHSRRPHQLSGGQQQRVALARALVYEPPVLLLDEPLGALDRRLRMAMQVELKELHRRVGNTFLYVTHDQEEALSLSDLVIVMREGRVEQIGAPSDLYDRPHTEFVANFVGDCNILEGTVQETRYGVEVVHAESGLCLYRGSVQQSSATARVVIRPEWIELTDSAATASRALPGRVVSQHFVGSEVVARCETALGQLVVRVPRTRAGTTAAPTVVSDGKSVSLNWDPEQTHLLERADSN